jgi:hypothetical protein
VVSFGDRRLALARLLGGLGGFLAQRLGFCLVVGGFLAQRLGALGLLLDPALPFC